MSLPALDTWEGQLARAPWTRQDGTDIFLGASGARMHAHNLSCRLGGSRHDLEDRGTDVRHSGSGWFREVNVRVCVHCGRDVPGRPADSPAPR